MHERTLQILDTLRAHEPELRARGVVGVALFGSASRGEDGETSDVDLAIKLDPALAVGGFSYFGRLENLRQRLSQIIGREADLVTEPVRKPRLRRELESGCKRAF